MAKKSKLLLLLVGILALFCVSLTWATNSPTADDYYYLLDRDKESDLALAITVALRLNHSAAYNMIGTDATSQLDEWMKSHTAKKCVRKAHNILIGSGSNEGFKVFFDCQTEDNVSYHFTIDDILIEDMKVVNWGRITEQYN